LRIYIISEKKSGLSWQVGGASRKNWKWKISHRSITLSTKGKERSGKT
jgi:hypothetical protein